ncbi:OmpA family protein [Lewinella sp. W8]|uniref:OmpA family protein n=1 Tax=Lewinella sp. W8 TaxID=2528208 RepID=UPI001067E4EB|nr:OmpA family protein [Lewinella sp. W8]MTB52529.1 OmpA family protein [Lewinella sp. W8]
MGYKDSVEVHRIDTIYFAFGSAEISPAALSVVRQLVQDRPDTLELYLEGHTDAVGSYGANDKLAMARSQNTLSAALQEGWPAGSVEIRHFGERRPVIRTNEREWRNRRVLLRSGLPRRYARFRGLVADERGLPLPGGVVAHGRYLEDTVRAGNDGSYEIWLPVDEAVRLDVYAENHFFKSHELTLKEASTPEPLVTRLAAAAPGSSMDVPDLYFVSNRTDLLEASFPTLPRLLQFMRTSPELSIELAGHVNSPGSRKGPGSWQFTLAENRAKLIHDYLIKRGISPDRLRYRGYSNYEMVFPRPNSPQEKRANRRVEIRILDKRS